MTERLLLAVVMLALQAAPAFPSEGRQHTMQPVLVSTSDPILNKANLDLVKRHIIGLGSRCTYVNKYNNNPCWSLASYTFYLNPDPGPDGHPQWNINCDTTRGDFNTLVIKDDSTDRIASVDFRPKEAVVFHSYGRAFESFTVESEQDQVMFATAVAAALKAIKGNKTMKVTQSAMSAQRPNPSYMDSPKKQGN